MKFLVKSPKYGDQEVEVDDNYIELVKSRKWYIHKAGQFLYIRSSYPREYLHRIITKAKQGMVVDHIDRNPLNNRVDNLRVVTIQENLRNQIRANNKTGYTGVAIGSNGKYTAQIKHNYKKIHLGRFDTIQEALAARLTAEKRLGW